MQTGWIVDVLRFTCFVSAPVDESVQTEIWSNLVGSEPDKIESRTRERSRVFQSQLDDGKNVQLIFQSDRADFISNYPDYAVDKIGVDSILEGSQTFYSSLATSKIQSKRLALGVVARAPAKDRLDSYQKLLTNVHSLSLRADESVSDISLQINRPIDSEIIDGLQINRLMRWNALRVTTFAVPQLNSQIAMVADNQESFFLQVELDLNTSEVFNRSFSFEDQHKIGVELLTEAQHILEHGEP